MSNYKYTVSVNPPTPAVAGTLVRTLIKDLKVQAHWDKNAGRINFEFDADTLESDESTHGDPLMVQRIKAAEAELRAAMQAAVDVGLNVQWVALGPNGNKQLIPDPTVIITRTY